MAYIDWGSGVSIWFWVLSGGLGDWEVTEEWRIVNDGDGIVTLGFL